MVQPGIKSEAKRAEYTVAGDFCRIFSENTNGLYWLSFLLTGDSAKAEQCFVSGLEDCATGNRVFKEWAKSWARRTIIRNALRLVAPRPLLANSVQDASGLQVRPGEQREVSALFELDAFDRFAFVMSVTLLPPSCATAPPLSSKAHAQIITANFMASLKHAFTGAWRRAAEVVGKGCDL